MPVLSQAVLVGQRAQPVAQGDIWVATTPTYAGLILQTSDANFASTYPGVQDFCWEVWLKPNQWFNQPVPLVTWNLVNASTVATSNLGLGMYPDDSGAISFSAFVLAVRSTTIATLSSSLFNTWIHVAMCRIGSTINVYANGVLVSQMTGVTTDFDAATLASNGLWNFSGPVGDRDETYGFALGCTWRNMRYTIGNNVYGNVSSFTPPPLEVDIAPVTGTQFIWWPEATTNLTTNPLTPDYEAVAYEFSRFNGSAGTAYIGSALYAYPLGQQLTPSDLANWGASTWTNNGTAPNQPKITTTGPAPIIGTSCGDFTATGTNVRISSTNSPMANFQGGFLMYIWFYVPANITNEMKTIVAVETANGFVLNIGRAGQGLDWLSVSAFGGTEKAYAPHIWARNAWNFLCIQKRNDGPGGPLVAWAGAQGDNYAANLNLTDSGAEGFNFAGSGNISIGCTSGSTVSSQMYFNQILTFSSDFFQTNAGIYPLDAASIPIFVYPTLSYPDSALSAAFDFQGTNGNTAIQPVYPV